MFKILSHTADVGIEVSAPSLEDLFIEAARGWKYCVIEDSPTQPCDMREARLRGDNPEDLLVQWLNELNYYFTVGQWILHDVIECQLSQAQEKESAAWRGIFVISGEPLDFDRHEICMEIKSVTYHQLEIQKSKDRYKTRVIFDI